MLLQIIGRQGQVLLRQPAEMITTDTPPNQLEIKQQTGACTVTLKLYQLKSALLWTGDLCINDTFTLETENSQPLLQVTVFLPASNTKSSPHLPSTATLLLHAGTTFSISQKAGHYNLLVAQFHSVSQTNLPAGAGLHLLREWLQEAGQFPRQRQVNPDSHSLQLCSHLLTSPYAQPILQPYLHLKLQELLLHLTHLLQTIPSPKFSQKESAGLQLVAKTLQEQPGKQFTLDTLSRLAGLNRTSLQTLFKAYYDTTLRSFIVRCRMEEAMRLVRETAVPLKEIAYCLGYAAPDHFYAAFKQYHGQTAGSLRKTGKLPG